MITQRQLNLIQLRLQRPQHSTTSYSAICSRKGDIHSPNIYQWQKHQQHIWQGAETPMLDTTATIVYTLIRLDQYKMPQHTWGQAIHHHWSRWRPESKAQNSRQDMNPGSWTSTLFPPPTTDQTPDQTNKTQMRNQYPLYHQGRGWIEGDSGRVGVGQENKDTQLKKHHHHHHNNSRHYQFNHHQGNN